jgi:hypothetical protein
VQELFDKVAEKNPQKALELLLKASEFILLKSTEVSMDRKIDPVVKFKVVHNGVTLANSEAEIRD